MLVEFSDPGFGGWWDIGQVFDLALQGFEGLVFAGVRRVWQREAASALHIPLQCVQDCFPHPSHLCSVHMTPLHILLYSVYMTTLHIPLKCAQDCFAHPSTVCARPLCTSLYSVHMTAQCAA